MKRFRIKNWEDFQHYKDRSPPWIKLHREMMQSRTWTKLDSRGRELMMVLMMVAAGCENEIDLDPDYIRRVGYMDHMPDLNPLFDVQFIEMIGDIEDASNCDQTLATDIPSVSVSASLSSKGGVGEKRDLNFERFWEGFPRKRRGSKDDALRAWRKAIKKSNADEIIQGSLNYAASDEVKRGYAKGTAAWLNAEGWRNDYAAPEPRGGGGYNPNTALGLALADTSRTGRAAPVQSPAGYLAAPDQPGGRSVLDRTAAPALPRPTKRT